MSIIVKQLGIQPYEDVLEAMRAFTTARVKDTPDEIWVLEHPSVFTLGQAGREEHILQRGDIPIVKSCRGGQVTYHGPGQLVIYVLLQLKRYHLNVRALVTLLENSVIDILAELGIDAMSQCKAPGVYVDEAKICSLGLRIKKGCSYHGLALNVDMDLTPFSDINPCGFADLKMTQIKNYVDMPFNDICNRLTNHLLNKLRYNALSPILAD